MTVDWNLVLSNVGGTAALVGAIAWVGRKFLSLRFDMDLENHKAKLSLAGQSELAKLSSNLEAMLRQDQVRFTILHEKRAEVVSTVYARLVRFIAAATDFLAVIEYGGGKSKSEKYAATANAGWDLVSYFDEHRIFLPPEICERCEELIKTVRVPVQRFHIACEMAEMDCADVGSKRLQQDEWMKGWDQIQQAVPPLKAALEDEFRTVLGVSAGKK